jgi:hypothetical protein
MNEFGNRLVHNLIMIGISSVVLCYTFLRRIDNFIRHAAIYVIIMYTLMIIGLMRTTNENFEFINNVYCYCNNSPPLCIYNFKKVPFNEIKDPKFLHCINEY